MKTTGGVRQLGILRVAQQYGPRGRLVQHTVRQRPVSSVQLALGRKHLRSHSRVLAVLDALAVVVDFHKKADEGEDGEHDEERGRRQQRLARLPFEHGLDH